MKNRSWADDDDEVPMPHETAVDSSGCIVRYSYKRDEFHRVIRTATRIRIVSEVSNAPYVIAAAGCSLRRTIKHL